MEEEDDEEEEEDDEEEEEREEKMEEEGEGKISATVRERVNTRLLLTESINLRSPAPRRRCSDLRFPREERG